MNSDKTLLVGVSDVFFYTKIRDAFRPAGYSLQRLRKQEDLIEKVSSLRPLAVILNMNDDQLNAKEALQTLKGHESFPTYSNFGFCQSRRGGNLATCTGTWNQ